ncbi:collagen binding domain-containing protein [Holzapfeliella sp. He02]|uniref:Collagen binding domain-containing protein n=1 Tax=Holzapfeliella saturejae TaxID=3082953 RepID=A0ABU8SEK4_9LACO
MKNKLTYIINVLMIAVLTLGYLVPLTQINVSAETTETADVKMTPESYSASRDGQTLNFNSSVKEFHPNDQIHFEYNWSWNRPSDYEGKTYQFSFKLPENISYTPGGGSIGNSPSFGSYSIKQDGTVTFTFSKNLDRFENLSSVLKTKGTVKGDIPNNSSISFEKFPNGSIPVKEEKRSSISNNLFPVTTVESTTNTFKNLQSIRGVSYINRTRNTLYQGASLISESSSILQTDSNSIVVTPVYLNADGSENRAEKPLVKDSDYSIDGTTIKLLKNTEHVLKVDYNFNVDTNKLPNESTTEQFKQTITLKSAEGLRLGQSTSPDFVVNYDPFIVNNDKSMYENNYYWQTLYNFNHKSVQEMSIITSADADSPKAHKLSENGFYVESVRDTSNNNGNKTRLVKNKDYTVTFNEDGTKVTVHLTNPTDDGIIINYRTTMDSYGIPDNTNSIKLSTTALAPNIEPSQSSSNLPLTDSRSISKSTRNSLFFALAQEKENIDYNQRIATWHYDINTNRYDNQTYDIENPLPNGITIASNPNLVLRYGSVRRQATPIPNTQNQYQVTGADGASFKITISNDRKSITTNGTNISTRYFLCYDTNFDSSQTNETEVTNQSRKYKFDYNQATATITKNDYSSRKTSSRDQLKINTTSKDGFMSRYPNVSSREITWDTVINPSRFTLPAQTIIDQISDGKITNFEVYKVNLNQYGTLDESNKERITQNITISDKKATFTPDNGSNEIYLLRVTASLDNMIIDNGKYITNEVKTNTNSNPLFLHDTYNLPNRGQFVNKSGVFNPSTKEIEWTIEFNKSQSKLFDAKIVDDPSNNQLVYYDDFTVEELNVDKNGDSTTVNRELNNDEYSVEKERPDDPTSNKFIITFEDPIEKPYKITYRTSPIFLNSPITNNYKLYYRDNNHNINYYEPEHHAEVQIPTSQDMKVNGKNSLLKLILKDDKGNLLVGEKFKFKIELLVENNNSITSEAYTDDKGSISWEDLKSGYYLIKQISTDSQYKIPDEWKNGKEINLGAPDTDSGNLTYEVINLQANSSSKDPNTGENNDYKDDDKGQSGTTEDTSVIPNNKDKESSQPQLDSSSTNESSQSSDSDSSLPQDKESAQSSENSQSDSSTTNSTTQSTTTQSSSNKPTSNLPQTGQKHDLTLKYVGIIIILISGFILYPALKKRR